MTTQQPSASGSGGGKRPRGRPLKSTVDDDEAAIKRRARVRKAQQAFQKRKEAAVRTLEETLSAVQAGVEEFSNAFSHFTTAFTEAGVADSHPELLRSLHGLTEQLLTLARTASQSVPSDIEAAPSGSSAAESTPPVSAGASGSASVSTSVSPGVDHLFLSDADPTVFREYSDDDNDEMQLYFSFLDEDPPNVLSSDLWPYTKAFDPATKYLEPFSLPSGISEKTTYKRSNHRKTVSSRRERTTSESDVTLSERPSAPNLQGFQMQAALSDCSSKLSSANNNLTPSVPGRIRDIRWQMSSTASKHATRASQPAVSVRVRVLRSASSSSITRS